jgi:hypothetical protein
MIVMSLRGAQFATKQSPRLRWGCFAACARNDMQTASLRRLQSASGEELYALMPSILDKAFKGEL